jgi:hypothetical protein
MYERKEHTEDCVWQLLQLVWRHASKVQLQIGRLWGTRSLSFADPCKSARVWTCHLNLINKEVKNVWISAYTLLVVVPKHKDNLYILVFWIYWISESADFTLASCVGVRVSNIRAAKNYRDERCIGLVHNHQVDFGIVPQDRRIPTHHVCCMIRSNPRSCFIELTVLTVEARVRSQCSLREVRGGKQITATRFSPSNMVFPSQLSSRLRSIFVRTSHGAGWY